MMRRLLLLLPLGLPIRAQDGAPTDVLKMNTFAQEYNRYAESLKTGVVDLRLWKRVVKAWEQIQ